MHRDQHDRLELPPGYRPAPGKLEAFVTLGGDDGNADNDAPLVVAGAGITCGMTTIPDGAVIMSGISSQLLTGVAFRAEG